MGNVHISAWGEGRDGEAPPAAYAACRRAAEAAGHRALPPLRGSAEASGRAELLMAGLRRIAEEADAAAAAAGWRRSAEARAEMALASALGLPVHRGDFRLMGGEEAAAPPLQETGRPGLGRGMRSRDGGECLTVYLSGPMAGIPGLNRQAFGDCMRLVEEAGHRAFSPAHHMETEKDGKSYKDLLMADLAWIRGNADALLMLEGWRGSKGAKAELALALALGLPVVSREFRLLETPKGWRPSAAATGGGGKDFTVVTLRIARAQKERWTAHAEAGAFRSLSGLVRAAVERHIQMDGGGGGPSRAEIEALMDTLLTERRQLARLTEDLSVWLAARDETDRVLSACLERVGAAAGSCS